jgi:CubicO group peptidase (beta-lactamase class C family)
MSLLEHLEAQFASATAVHDEGVPSVSMALIDRSGALSSHVITSGSETPDTLYQACSISKAITSLAIAKLYDDGVISYKDRIIDHVPQGCLERLGKNEPFMEFVTVESLVSHRSGLSQHGFPGYSTSPRPKEEEIFLGRPPANTPRIRFTSFPFAQLSYSGGGYLLLQIYLEHVLCRPFHEIMQTLVLQPLRMTRSTFADLNENEHNYAKAFATAEMLGTTAPCGYHSFSERAAAGMWTTSTDLLKAVSAIQHSLHNDNGFLTKDTARMMLTKVAPNQPRLSMAMGWGSDDLYFGHAGDNDPGYNTYVFGSHDGIVNSTANGASGSPSHINNVAFAIMTNSALGFPVIRKIVSAVFYLDRWSSVPSLPGNFGSMSDIVPYPSSRTASNDQSWKAWVGKWNDQWTFVEDEGFPKLRFRDLGDAMFLFPAAEAGNNEDGSQVASFVAESCNVAVRLLHQDGQRCLEVIQSGMREVMDRQHLS